MNPDSSAARIASQTLHLWLDDPGDLSDVAIAEVCTGLQIFEVHPLFTPPTGLPASSETWFPILAADRQSHAVG